MRRLTCFLVVLMGLLGCGISIILFNWLRDADRATIEAEFRRAVDERASSFERELSLNVELLHGIKSLFVGSDDVSHETFARVSQEVLSRHANVQALEWIPRIGDRERESTELARRSDFPSFQFTERNDNGEMLPVKKKEVYFPVYYVEPYVGNESALGFDLSSNPVRLAAIEESAESGAVQLTASITLVQEMESQKGFLAFVPVYAGEATTIPERGEKLRGFALGVYRIGDIFSASILSGAAVGIDISLMDETDSASPEVLHHHQSRKGEDPVETVSYRKPVQEIGGRKWAIIASPTPSFYQDRFGRTPWLALAGGILVTLVLIGYVVIVERRTAIVNALVRERTSELHSSEETIRSILNTAVEAIITIDDAGIVLSFNPAAENIFGYESAEVLGQNVSMLMPEPHQSAHDGYIRHYLETGERNVIGMVREEVGRHKGGVEFPMEFGVSEVDLGGSRQFTGIVRDISERKHLEEQLRKAATFDSLTGLFNRGSLMAKLGAAVSAARRYDHPLSVCLFDVDMFKRINDTYGHVAGDQVLSAIGSLLKDGIRAADFAGRYGGDEFCAVFSHVPAGHAAQSLDRIRERLKETVFESENGRTFNVSASFGVADFDAETVKTDKEMIEKADRALYAAKQDGRNRIAVNGETWTSSTSP